MSETLGSKIDKLLEINSKILESLEVKKEPYKYQSVIDYLKGQGRITGKEPVIEEVSSGCITTPEEAINVLQNLIEEQKKTRCLTKEDLLSFFKKPTPTTNWEPPFRK